MDMARYQQLMDLFMHQPLLNTADICEKLGISPATARRHLQKLEDMGKIKRIKGGAILVSQLQVFEETGQDPYLKAKKSIAEAAVKLVKPGDTVFIDAGSTNNEVANELIKCTNLTVITNSIEIAHKLLGKNELSVVVCGGTTGEVDPVSSIVGPFAESLIHQFRANVFILGCSGIEITHGITDPFLSAASIKRAMIENALEVVLVSDHSKFGKINKAYVCGLDQIAHLITDDRAPAADLNRMKEMGINVTTV